MGESAGRQPLRQGQLLCGIRALDDQRFVVRGVSDQRCQIGAAALDPLIDFVQAQAARRIRLCDRVLGNEGEQQIEGFCHSSVVLDHVEDQSHARGRYAQP